ncbi:MAG TPA: MarR family transcriptional regulator, partial [Terriglobia bacterium]|nr:MarR family transcriptional regulator [Terriglobia bacterium]
REDLQAIYGHLTRTAIHTVKPDNIATFLGRKLSPLYQGEMGNRFNTRIEGTRIKHTMGPVSIKRYDKFGLILRIEVTVNDVSFFSHYRTVEQRDGSTVTRWAPMRKSIYSLPALREALQAANRRYLEFLSTLDDPTAGIDRLQKVSEPVRENERSYPGLNFFSDEDQTLIEALARGEFNLHGLQNKTLRAHLDEKTSGQVSRLLKRLRFDGLVKKVGHTYRYDLTVFGKQVIASGLKLKNLVLIPQLALAPAP